MSRLLWLFSKATIKFGSCRKIDSRYSRVRCTYTEHHRVTGTCNGRYCSRGEKKTGRKRAPQHPPVCCVSNMASWKKRCFGRIIEPAMSKDAGKRMPPTLRDSESVTSSSRIQTYPPSSGVLAIVGTVLICTFDDAVMRSQVRFRVQGVWPPN